MRKDVITLQPICSSFLSCEKDTQAILEALFVHARPYSDILKRLLVINKPDCLDMDNKQYDAVVRDYNVGRLIKQGYIRLNPKIARKQFENIKSFVIVTFDDFSTNRSNPQFRDCTVNFDIICYNDEWVLDDYAIRPVKIAGYIDGILNNHTNLYKGGTNSLAPNVQLSGYGSYIFLGLNFAVLNEDLSMYTLSYKAIHFTEDKGKLK